jgi:hypothetical protein
MTWIIGNIADCTPIETFALAAVTPAPSPHFNSAAPADAAAYTFANLVPQTIEDWCTAQQEDPSFAPFVADLPAAAVREGLHIYLPSANHSSASLTAKCFIWDLRRSLPP